MIAFALLLVLSAAPDAAAPPERAAAYREFLLARLATAEGDLGAAALHLDQALTFDPEAAEIRASRALVALRQGRVTEAIARGKEATEIDGENALAWDVLSQAWAQHHRLRGEGLQEAVAAQRQVVRLRPDEPDAKLVLARRILAGGDLDGGAAVVDEAVRQGGRPGALEMQIVEAYLRAGRRAEALARLGNVLPEVGGAPGPALALSRLLDEEGHAQEAETLILELARRAPPDPGVEREVLSALLAAGRADDAARVAERARDRWAYPGLALLSGRALRSAGDLIDAEDAYRAATASMPDEPLGWRELARLLARRGEHAEAAAVLLRGAEGVAETAQRMAMALRLEAAEELLSAGRPSEALAILEEVPPLAGLLLRRGRALALALARTRGFDAAASPLASLAEADGVPPEDLMVIEAEVRLASFGEKTAAEWLDAAVARSRAPEQAALRAAQFWGGRGLPGRAVAVLRDARDTQPVSADLLVELAGFLDSAGDAGQAASLLREALALVPDHALALNNLAYLMTLGDGPYDEAVRLAEKAVDGQPDNAAFLDTLGWALHRAGRTLEARARLQRAAGAGGGDDPVIREHLGDVERALGALRGAAENYRRALGLGAADPVRVRDKLEALAADLDGAP